MPWIVWSVKTLWLETENDSEQSEWNGKLARKKTGKWCTHQLLSSVLAPCLEGVGDNLQCWWQLTVLVTTYNVGDNLQTWGAMKTSMSQSVLVTTYRQAAWQRPQCHRVCWWQLTDKRCDEDFNVIECVDGITPLQLKGHSVPCGDKVTLVWLVWCIAVIAFLHTQRQQNCYVLDLVLLEQWLQHSYCTHYICSNNSACSTAIAHST